MFKKIIPCDSFRELSVETVLNIYSARFKWLSREQKEILRRGIVFGQTCQPPTDAYYWTHLARVIVTISIYQDWLKLIRQTSEPRVLDVGAHQPIAALWRIYSESSMLKAQFTYTTTAGIEFHSESASYTFDATTVPVTLDGSSMPFQDQEFDLVVLAEVIEHVDRHPQYVLCEIARILKNGGYLLLSTPNMSSWKKIYAMTNGNWGFDSPTFAGEWGHRYEYSYYQMREALRRSGFCIERKRILDVYFDDPRGIASKIQFAGLSFLKVITGEHRAAAKMWLRGGSGMFFLARKVKDVTDPEEEGLLGI